MQHVVRKRRRGSIGTTIVAALLALVLAACSDGHVDVRPMPAIGWPTYGGTDGNTNFTYAQVPDGLKLSWTRPVGGPITAPLSLNGYGDVAVTSRSTAGCNMFVFDSRNGRKNYCKRMRPGVEMNTAAMDQYGQAYIGEQSMLLAFNGGGSIRWRMPMIGVPLSAKFAGPGKVLLTTTQGQLLLVNAQTNVFEAPEVRLRPDADPDDPLHGLGDCVSGGPQCALPSPPAVDPAHERFFLNHHPADGPSQVKAVSYAGRDGNRTLADLWTADLPGGVMGPAVSSQDGKTVYAFSRSGSLFALDAATGKQRWTYDLGGHGFATMTVSPDGLIVPAGGIGSPLTVLRDAGDKAEQVVKRDDLQTVTLSTLTNSGTVWTIVREGADQHLMLTEVSTEDGKTLRSLALPGATGFTTGIAVSP
ncbi:MAG: PQQ-binding-like beta-propeller repeat protein, partial [Gordonia sp. (in: high G+C Gram-positive bacteria)]